MLDEGAVFCSQKAALFLTTASLGRQSESFIMLEHFKNFTKDESGAVTVDWVVLTAAVVALAIAAITAINTATGGVGSGIGAYLSGWTF